MIRFRVILAGVLGLSTVVPSAHAGDETVYEDEARIAFANGDVVSAINWHRKAAELGHLPSILEAARLLDYAEMDAEAITFYEAGYDAGDLGAGHRLGTMLLAGEGVAPDRERGLNLVIEAADNGYGPAIANLANIYERGLYGVERDDSRARHWLELGVEAGIAGAIRRMARAYKMGQLGLEPDDDKAAALNARLEE